ncbi:MAG: shikimate kinase [Oscillatoriales cyanobacterium SM2_2_1]|nr:shikimate kinase [Oscillatoriales cyanobacterium SM2_2_1]
MDDGVITKLQGTAVFLVGMMGAGKSTLGRHLAQRWGYGYVDTDAVIEQWTGRAIAELFATEGELSFRQREQQVLAQVAACVRVVVSTGGGIVTQPLNWMYLRDGVVVWLDVPIEVLLARLRLEPPIRPLLQQPNWEEVVEDLWHRRRDRYAQADIHLPIAGTDTTETVGDRLCVLLEEQLDPARLKRAPFLQSE